MKQQPQQIEEMFEMVDDNWLFIVRMDIAQAVGVVNSRLVDKAFLYRGGVVRELVTDIWQEEDGSPTFYFGIVVWYETHLQRAMKPGKFALFRVNTSPPPLDSSGIPRPDSATVLSIECTVSHQPGSAALYDALKYELVGIRPIPGHGDGGAEESGQLHPLEGVKIEYEKASGRGRKTLTDEAKLSIVKGWLAVAKYKTQQGYCADLYDETELVISVRTLGGYIKEMRDKGLLK
jgi:hypothetical protein